MLKYKTFRKFTLMSITMFVLCISYIAPANATACACYFSKYDDCIEAGLALNATKAECITKCEESVGTYNKVEYSSDSEKAFQISVACKNYHTLALEKIAGTTPLTAKPTQSQSTFKAITPQLNIDIPGVKFTPAKLVSGHVVVNYLSEYIRGVYAYLISFGIIVAVMFIMIGGFQYAFGGLSQEQVSKAKTRIKNATTGLVLLMCVILILETVNPALLNSNEFRLFFIEKEEDESWAPDKPSGGRGVTAIKKLLGPYSGAPCSIEGITDAANKLHEMNICVGACHCAWTASGMLNYVGCTATHSGNAKLLGVYLEEKDDWITEFITPSNSGSFGPAAVFLKSGGHVGVSIGNGKSFESGTAVFFRRVQHNTGGTCPLTTKKAQESPGLCETCGKIPDHKPDTGRYYDEHMKNGKLKVRCGSNQGWSLGKMSRWAIIVRPMYGSGWQQRGCCKVKWKQRLISENLCKIMGKGSVWQEANDKSECPPDK